MSRERDPLFDALDLLHKITACARFGSLNSPEGAALLERAARMTGGLPPETPGDTIAAAEIVLPPGTTVRKAREFFDVLSGPLAAHMLTVNPDGEETYQPIAVFLRKRPPGLALYRVIVEELLHEYGMDPGDLRDIYNNSGWDDLYTWLPIEVRP